MKRNFLVIWTLSALMLGTLVAASPLPGNVAGSSVALAVTTQGGGAGSGGGPACAPGEVELSVQVNKGDSNCVKPDANGGVIITYLKLILRFLSGGVGVVILLMLIIAGVQYITAAGQPEQVRSAKNRITNAFTALVLFLIAFAVLNLIIPGGIFA